MTFGFERFRGIIVVWAWLRGPRGERDVRLALDTAAVKTLILPDVLDDIGYSARDGEDMTIIRGANEAASQVTRSAYSISSRSGSAFRTSRFTCMICRTTESMVCLA